jgi:type VI protein secretion system component VasK
MNSAHSALDTALHRLGATGRQWERRYQVPWLMLVGEPGCGRTSLMAGADLRRPYGSPTRKEMEADGWGVWNFDQGVVIDMPGMTEVPTPEWRSVTRRLKQIRGLRPIDGLMLAVSAAELVGPKALSDVQLDRKAQSLFNRLQSLRTELGVHVPIYVIITRSDTLPGFAAFCRTLPPRMRDEMLGWSSPYSPEEPYSPAWVDEAFQGVDQALSQMQLELLADGWGELSGREAAFLFPSELRAMTEPVRRLLDVLFQSTPFTQPSMLRGIYFCGDPDLEGSAEPSRGRASGPCSPAFVTHLLERKAFPESGLAGPHAEAVRANRRRVAVLQGGGVACALLAVVLGLAALWTNHRPAKVAQPARPPNVVTNIRPQEAPAKQASPSSGKVDRPAWSRPVQPEPARRETWDEAPPPRPTWKRQSRRSTAWKDTPAPPPGGDSPSYGY